MATEVCNFNKLKEKLSELGLYELGMNMKDMVDLMSVIRNSRDSAEQEELLRESLKTSISSDTTDEAQGAKKGMVRRYKNAPERRLPWNLFPIPEQLSLEQKAYIMAAYKEQLSVCRYRRAKTSSVFADWNCVFSIPILKHRLSPEYKSSVLHTRSGRTIKSNPHYIVDDDSDTETSVTRKCRKKMRKNYENVFSTMKPNSSHDTPALMHSNFDLPETDKKENKLSEAHASNQSEKMQVDNIASEKEINSSQINRKVWRSPSPDDQKSKMVVVAQVHRESQNVDNIQVIDDDNEQDNKVASNAVPRKRPKRLKISVDE